MPPHPEQLYVNLSAEERAWLAEHRVLRAGLDSNWAPVEFVDDHGAPQGISVTYIKRLERLLGVRFQLVPIPTWQQAMEGLQEGTIDLLPAVAITPARQEKMQFTASYLSLPTAIFSAATIAYLGGLQALNGKTVAVVKGEAPQDWLQADWPKLDLIRVPDTREGVRQVARGKTVAFVGNMITTSYYIGQSGLTQVKVVGDTPYDYKLRMAVRQNWPILAGILQKGLDAIPRHERDSIYHDWISIQYAHRFDYGLLWQVVAVAALILVVIL